MRVRLSASAERELDQAFEFYEQQRAGLGAEFLGAVRGTSLQVSEWPLAGRPFTRELRSTVVRRFPYWLIYEQRDSLIWITAVAHQSRGAEYWRSRWDVRESATAYLRLAA